MRKEPIRKIHKRLYDETVNAERIPAAKYLLAVAIKASNRIRKAQPTGGGSLAAAVFVAFKKSKVDDVAKKTVNHQVSVQAELEKDEAIRDAIDWNRVDEKWFYLASSHADCAKDHLPYQGRLYVDEKAPAGAISYAKSRGLRTLQWVLGEPAWFVTRPNCRHYFMALTEEQVRGKRLKDLRKKYKTEGKLGDRRLSTPASGAVEEYEDRLRMLRAMYREYPTEMIKKEIEKAELLVKKWKKRL